MLNYSSYHYNIPASINNVSLAGYSYSGVVAIMPATIIAKNVNPPAVLREDAIQTISASNMIHSISRRP